MPLSLFRDHARLWLTLLVAAVQGVILFRLHVAIEGGFWPATDGPWLAIFYTLTILLPTTFHLFAAHLRERTLWVALAAIAVIGTGLAWHFGANVSGAVTDQELADDGSIFAFSVTMLLLWLLCMPFLRCRLEQGRWSADYAGLFSTAWQNKLTLLEALVFTGAFWLLLELWVELFQSLGYELFENLFHDPAFVYPFTAITFGLAMHLVGSTERLVSVAREQVLGLLKWLAPVAGVILLLFTPTLLVKLPELIVEGERAIGAVWLLWLLLVSVALLNAGYQDGKPEQPYPRWLGLALRVAVPTMPLLAFVAIYALILRIHAHGITVSRVYGLVTAVVALAYAIGYAVAALRRGPWLRGIERVNVAVALGGIAVLFLLCTPLLSPYRLATGSQAARAASLQGEEQESVLTYLRFEAGVYGRRRLAELAQAKGGDREEALARLARDVKALAGRYERRRETPDEVRARLNVYPAGRTLEEDLLKAMSGCSSGRASSLDAAAEATVLVDLNGDGTEEAVWLRSYTTSVFAKTRRGWRRIGSGTRPAGDVKPMIEDLAAGRIAVEKPVLSDLRIGDRLIEMVGGDGAFGDDGGKVGVSLVTEACGAGD